MSNDLKQLVEFSKYLETILDETKSSLKENIEIKDMYNSMIEEKTKKTIYRRLSKYLSRN